MIQDIGEKKLMPTSSSKDEVKAAKPKSDSTQANSDLAKQLPTKSKSPAKAVAKLTPAEWKSEERIAGLMHYPAGGALMKRLKKKKQKRVELSTTKVRIVYTVCLGEHVPLIQVVPAGYEIYHRLILRAALSEGLFEFNLTSLPNL